MDDFFEQGLSGSNSPESQQEAASPSGSFSSQASAPEAYHTDYRQPEQQPLYPPYGASQSVPPSGQSPYADSQHTGRKESPYASSPYVASRQSEYTYQPQPYQKPPRDQAAVKPRQGRSVWRTLLSCVLTVALVAAGCGFTALSVNRYWEQRSNTTVNALTEKIDALEDKLSKVKSSNSIIGQQLPSSDGALTPRQLYAMSANSVVGVSCAVTQESIYGTSEGTSSGSGFILTEDGYIVTNYHVVQSAKKVTVITHDGTSYTAEVKGYDSTNDVAVLKVEAEGLPAAPVGSSSDLLIGDMVVAIGSPLGELTATQTVGYVSGMNREVTTDNTIINMIQTDAAINPGNSGGPLFNAQGQVIGITTAKYSGTTGSGASIEGIGFAIPIDDVVPIINDLIEYGHVTGAYLGVTVQNTDTASAQMFDLPTGAYVLEVVEGGSASRAGIQPKDLIIELGGIKVSNVTELTRALRTFKAGDETTITVIRGGKEKVLKITLDEKPYTPESGYPQPDENMPQEGNYEDWYNWFFGNNPSGD